MQRYRLSILSASLSASMAPALLVALLSASACVGDIFPTNPYLSDDEGKPRPSFEGDHPDELSSPYALGTKVHIQLSNFKARSIVPQRMESSAPSVLSVDMVTSEPDHFGADCTARGEGEAEIRVFDASSKLVRSAKVTVKTPDRVRVLSHGTMRMLGRTATSLDQAEAKEARVLSGNKGVYAIAYFRGTEQLFGRDILVVDAPQGVKFEGHSTRGVITNEWLFLAPQMPGTFDVKLRHGPTQIGSLPLVSVGESDIASLALVEETVAERKDGNEIWLLARAKDSMGRIIDGVWCDWTVDGVAQVGKDNDTKKTSGDLFRYTSASKAAPRTVLAKHGAHMASFQVKADKTWISDTTYLGCSVARGRGGPGAVVTMAGLLLVAGLWLRRYRRLPE